MPDLNKRFQAGRMNKDLDERLVPNGEYRDALNVEVATSEGSEVGSLQTIMGTFDMSTSTIDPNNILNGYCVGSIADEKNDKLYWFIAGNGKDIIAEFDYQTKVVTPVLVDIFPVNTVVGPDSGRALNFDRSYLITGINIIDDMLFWTDNNTEPKKVNITRSKLGTLDFNTHTDFYVRDTQASGTSITYIPSGPVKQEHLTVIKKSPPNPPVLEMKSTTRGDVDLDGIRGEIIGEISDVDPSNGESQPMMFMNPDTGMYTTDPVAIIFQAGSGFDATPDFKPLDYIIIYHETDAGRVQMRCQIQPDNFAIISGQLHCEIIVLSGDPGIPSADGIYKVELEQGAETLFQFKYPRFACRYKYEDGEYSCFSPFTEPAFLPGKYDYMPKEGYNLAMVNQLRYLAIKNFVHERQLPDDVISIDILYKESNSSNVYSVKTIKRVTPDPSGVVYDAWNAIDSKNIDNSNAQKTKGFLEITSEMIHAILPANQLLRSWDNVPRKALAQDMIGNRLVYGNYLQNYDLFNHSPNRIKALKRMGNITGYPGGVVPALSDIEPKLNVTLTSNEVKNEMNEQYDAGKTHLYRSAKSIKTLRTYQLGVVYIDEFGRETPVFSTNSSSITVPKDTADQGSKLKAQILTPHPQFAKSFKFFIKETSNEYYNLAMDRWYDAEDGNIWISFPSSERNKVDEETFLILKKEHDADTFIKDSARYKILSISNEAPLFVKTERKHKGVFVDDGTLIGMSTGTGWPRVGGMKMYLNKGKFEELNWAGSDQTEGVLFSQDLSLFELRFSSSAGISKWHKISTITYDGTGDGWYVINFERPLTEDVSVVSTDNTFVNRYQNVEIDLMKSEVHNKPEFEGRFFVKILKDETLIDKIIHPSPLGEAQYSVVQSIKSQFISPSQYQVDKNNGGYGGNDWYGTTTDPMDMTGGPHVNISEVSGTNNWYHSVGQGGCGQDYWKAAGNDKGTELSINDSSGWFIDHIEGFRRFKTTKLWVSGKDNSYATHEYNMGNAIWWPNYNSNGPFGPSQQLQLMGTCADGTGGNNTYLNQPNNKKPVGVLINSDDPCGGIVPSIGIDPIENIIHLSYAGIGKDEGSGDYTGTTTALNSSFLSTGWANEYVADQMFIDTITTPGTIWRWKEDPDQVLYQTLPYSPSGSANEQDTEIWQKNINDAAIDNEKGVSLYNYVRFADYAMKPHHKHEVRQNLPWGGWTYIGRHDHANFVSENTTDHNSYHWNTVYATSLTFNHILHNGLVDAHHDDFDNLSSGGWYGPIPSNHDRYPMITQDWKKPWNKRRRFQFHAKTLMINSDGSRDGLGATGAQYLPTNSILLPSWFGTDGIVCGGTDEQGNAGACTTVPATPAPGIRADGMYSGHADPSGSWTLTNFDSGSSQDNIPFLQMKHTDGTESPPAGSVTWEILEKYNIWSEDKYSSSNPAIWETEPKEDVGLDIYYEVGQIYPIKLNNETIEQFVGPVATNLELNSKVSCRTYPTLGNPTGTLALKTPGFIDNIKEFDIRVEAVNGNNVFLADITGVPLDEGSIAPAAGDILVFTRSDGGTTEAMVDQVINVGGNDTGEFRLDPNVHNYQVTLPWHNCYSFGNGVESDRIRDDFNQVTIDNGPRASLTIEEPYEEERRSSGLIYSGIYNTTSGVNNLNQFIQAEKITKDLNPIYGSIQKLHARNTDLLTLCEDKVFKIIAHKDALYKADGNMDLIATENVLGQTVPIVGEYGISKNPESFASESYRAYFTDKVRGAVLRLSQDGLTTISDVGMRDWFADNLRQTTRLIGSVDDKKSEYNLTADYSDYPFSIPPIERLSTWARIEAHQKCPSCPWVPSGKLLIDPALGGFSIGDSITGPGIPPGAIITNSQLLGGGQPKRLTISPPIPSSPSWLMNYWGTPDEAWSWGTYITITHPAEIIEPQSPSGTNKTVTFSEKSKGWVSFKSWVKEKGISLNNSYYTFKGGNLHEHHVNTTRNNFYSTQFDSGVTFLFNEIPGTVKSFQTLNYEGSQSKVTPDGGLGQTSHSGEYWDNYLKTGWYVHNMYTNLQHGSLHEFKNKEGKWFADIKGTATEWRDDGKAGNIDTKEFSYQGIDEAGFVTTVSGGYTSWDCVHTPDPSPCGLIDTGIVVLDDWESEYWTPFSRPNTTNDSNAAPWPANPPWANQSEWLNDLLSYLFKQNPYDPFTDYGIYVCTTNVNPYNCIGFVQLEFIEFTNPFTGATQQFTNVWDMLQFFANEQYPGCLGSNIPACINPYEYSVLTSSNPYQTFINIWQANSARASVWDQSIYDANFSGDPTDMDACWDNTTGYTSQDPNDFNYFGNDPNQWYLNTLSMGPICETESNELNYTCVEISGQGGSYFDEAACLADTETACGGATWGWNCEQVDFSCGGYSQVMTGVIDMTSGVIDYDDSTPYTLCNGIPQYDTLSILAWFFNDPLKQNLNFKDYAYLSCDNTCGSCTYRRLDSLVGQGALTLPSSNTFTFNSVQEIINHFIAPQGTGPFDDFPDVYHFMNFNDFVTALGDYNNNPSIVERLGIWSPNWADCTDQTVTTGDACIETIGGEHLTKSDCISSPTCDPFDPCDNVHDVVVNITSATNTNDPQITACEDGSATLDVQLLNGATQWTVQWVQNFTPHGVIWDDTTIYSGNTTSTSLNDLEVGPYAAYVTDDLGCVSVSNFNIACVNTDPCPDVPEQTLVVTQPSGYTNNQSCTGNDAVIEVTVDDLFTANSWTWEVIELTQDPNTLSWDIENQVYTDNTNYQEGDTVTYAVPYEGRFQYIIHTDDGCSYASDIIIIQCAADAPCSVVPTQSVIASDSSGSISCCDCDGDGIADGVLALGTWVPPSTSTNTSIDCAGNTIPIDGGYANCHTGGVTFMLQDLPQGATSYTVKLEIQDPVTLAWTEWTQNSCGFHSGCFNAPNGNIYEGVSFGINEPVVYNQTTLTSDLATLQGAGLTVNTNLSYPLLLPGYGLPGYINDITADPNGGVNGSSYSGYNYRMVVTMDTGCEFELDPFTIDCPNCPDHNSDGSPDYACGSAATTWDGCCDLLCMANSSAMVGFYDYVGPNNLICANDSACNCISGACDSSCGSWDTWFQCGNSNYDAYYQGGQSANGPIIGPNNLPCAADFACTFICGNPGAPQDYTATTGTIFTGGGVNWGSGGCPCDASEPGCADSYNAGVC